MYNLMTRIFKDEKQPLLNRDDYFFKVNPLAPNYIKAIMKDNDKYTPNNLLIWWCLSGGIPKYLEWLNNAGSSPFEHTNFKWFALNKRGDASTGGNILVLSTVHILMF